MINDDMSIKEMNYMALKNIAEDKENMITRVAGLQADYFRTKNVALVHGGDIVRAERLDELFRNPRFIEVLELTYPYNSEGSVWFWAESSEKNREGFIRMDKRRALKDSYRSTLIGYEDKDKICEIPFDQKVHVTVGTRPIAVSMWMPGIGTARFSLDYTLPLTTKAPLIVFEQDRLERRSMFYYKNIRN